MPEVEAQNGPARDGSSMQSFAEACRDWDLSRLKRAWANDPGRMAVDAERLEEVLNASATYWADTEWSNLSYPNASLMLGGMKSTLEQAPRSLTLGVLRVEALLRADRQSHLEECIDILERTNGFDHLPYRRVYIASAAYFNAQRAGDEAAAEKLRVVAFEIFESILANPPRNRLEQRCALQYLLPTLSAACDGFDLAPIAADARRRSKDDWLPLVAEGIAQRKYAWSVRGRGVAATVSPEAWDIFRARMNQAATVLARAHEMRPAFPEAAASMIDVSKSLSGDIEEIGFWFSRVLSAEASWMPALEEYMWAVRPRWHGSVPLMMQTVVQIAEMSDRHPDYENYLFDAIEMIGEDAGTHHEIWTADHMAFAVRKVLERQIKEDRNADRARQRLLGIAWARHNWPSANELVTELGEQSSWHTLRQFRVHHQDVLDDVMLHQATGHDDIVKGLRAEQAGDHRSAAEAFERAIAEMNEPAPLLVALRHHAISNRWAADFAEGERVDLSAERGLPGWRVWTGSAAARDDTVVLSGSGGAWVLPAIEPGRRFEMHARLTQPAGAGNAWSRLIIGYDWLRDFERWITVSFRWHDSTARMRYRYTDRQSEPISKPLRDGEVNVRILRYDDALAVFADEELLYRGPIALGYRYSPGDGVGLSVWIDGENREATFEEISVQRLTRRPEELEGPNTPFNDGN